MSGYGEGSYRTSPAAGRAPERPRLVFFGSGPVAAASLKLAHAWADIEAVITKPQPPHHKEPFPVLELAGTLGLPVHTPNGKHELSELVGRNPFSSRIGLVIDYGFIINQDVIDSFELGIINSHFSLLPEWRGADPITFAILSGQPQTGVSLMRIVAAMDEGPLLGFGIQEIDDTTTTPALTKQLILLSDALLQTELPRYISGEAKLIDQLTIAEKIPGYPAEPTYSRKLAKQDGLLDFSKPAVQLEREIRAYLEWPKSRMTLAGKEVVLITAHVWHPETELTEELHLSPGSAFVHGKQLLIMTGDGLLSVDRLKPAGKPDMPIAAFLAGYGKQLQP